jgi:hypothetical protein
LPLEERPEPGMHAGHERHHDSDGAHSKDNHAGQNAETRTCPLGPTKVDISVPWHQAFVQVEISRGRCKASK